MKEIFGKISSEESLGLVDGPGIRYVVFLQGCKLRCIYCHNPETWDLNAHSYLITPQELISKIERYIPYFGSNGGVTFSGGEPLLQPEFLLECLKLCKEKNIHVVLDTAGVGFGEYEEILSLVDLVILDIKSTDNQSYKQITGFEMTSFNKFLDDCQKYNKKMWLRQVIVPGINDTKESVEQLKQFALQLKGIEKIELLPYKNMGSIKYKSLKLKERLEGVPNMNENACKNLEKLLN